MKQRYALALVLAVISSGSLILGASAEDPFTAGIPSSADKTATLDEVHHINQKEIRVSKIALEKSHSSEVRNFAQKMVKQHGSADGKVLKLAQSEDITLQPFALSNSEQQKVDQLQSLNGSDFDRAYIDAMKEGHKAALAQLQTASASTTDPQIKSLIQSMIPTVKHHEQLATNVQKDQENEKG